MNVIEIYTERYKRRSADPSACSTERQPYFQNSDMAASTTTSAFDKNTTKDNRSRSMAREYNDLDRAS